MRQRIKKHMCDCIINVLYIGEIQAFSSLSHLIRQTLRRLVHSEKIIQNEYSIRCAKWTDMIECVGFRCLEYFILDTKLHEIFTVVITSVCYYITDFFLHLFTSMCDVCVNNVSDVTLCADCVKQPECIEPCSECH